MDIKTAIIQVSVIVFAHNNCFAQCGIPQNLIHNCGFEYYGKDGNPLAQVFPASTSPRLVQVSNTPTTAAGSMSLTCTHYFRISDA